MKWGWGGEEVDGGDGKAHRSAPRPLRRGEEVGFRCGEVWGCFGLLYIVCGVGRRAVDMRRSDGRWGAPLFITSGEGSRSGTGYRGSQWGRCDGS
jgi:hypothetical protein